tara:strand:- start:48 stop:374 length:327 start_codon:yes stop_codon:yes gene_type:complete
MATSNIDKQSFGQAGATLLSGTEGVVKEICAITIIEDTIFDGHDDDTDGFADADHSKWYEFTDSGVAEKQLFRTTAANGVTVPAGITIYGQFSAVKLRSGTVLCYHAA